MLIRSGSHFRPFPFKTIILLLSFTFYSVQSYTFAGHEIKDLVKKDIDAFMEEASSWMISQFEDSNKPIKANQCSQALILGGPGVLISNYFSSTHHGQMGEYYEREYIDLPAHQSVRFSFSIWALDSWEDQDSVDIYIDNDKIYSWYPKRDPARNLTNICGEDYVDLGKYTIYGRKNHNAGSLRLRFVSQLDESSRDESFGVRDIHLLFAENTDQDVAYASSFGSSGPSDYPYNCSKGYYRNSTPACDSCSKFCGICFGGASSDCDECASRYYFDGKTCENSCSSGCAVCSGPKGTDCQECDYGYMMFEGTCRVPCPSIDDYLHKDGSCSDECLAPLVVRTKGGAKFCVESLGLEESGVNGVIIGASVSVAIVLVAIVIYFYIRKRRIQKQRKLALIRKEQKEQAEQREEGEQREHTEAPLQELHAYVGEIIEKPLQLKDISGINIEEEREDQIQDNMKERAKIIKV